MAKDSLKIYKRKKVVFTKNEVDKMVQSGKRSNTVIQ